MSLAIVFSLTSVVQAGHWSSSDVCKQTASLTAFACVHEVADDYYIERAHCINLTDSSAQASCFDEANDNRTEARQLCSAQRQARVALCGQLGPNAYDQTTFWRPSNFVNPLDIGGAVPANPYLPLIAGTKTYSAGDESIEVTITSDTKLIEGVTCVTAKDVVADDGQVIEDTDDWFAQDIFGAVWYCGEIAKNFESFEGDNPDEVELVDVEGSWKAFRDHAQPGILMQANPIVGQVYRQEVLLGDAEDAAEVLSINADTMLPGDSCEDDGDEIAELVDELCDADCVVTRDFTPLEPGHVEHKYYARHIGLILEVNEQAECAVLNVDD